MNKSESLTKLAVALTKAQAEMPVIKMNSRNPFLKYKYADLGALITAIRPVLAKHEFSVIQLPVSDGDKIGVDTMLLHSSGEWIQDAVFFAPEGQKGLSQAQTVGVVITYARRYALAALLGLFADEDTDASENNDGELPPQQLEKKPVPDKKPVVPATDMQRLKADYSTRFREAKALGVVLPSLNGGAKEEEIKAAIDNADNLIKAKRENGQAVGE